MNENTNDEIERRLNELEALELQSGKPKVGWICLRSPVEMIEAFGAVPIRILPGDNGQEYPNESIRLDGCSFCRQCLRTIGGNFRQDLTAVIGGQTCDQMRRMIDTVRQEFSIPVRLISFPRTSRSEIEPYFKESLQEGYRWLSSILETKPAKEVLEQTIQSRQKLYKRINALRQRETIGTKLLRRIGISPLPSRQLFGLLEKIEPLEEGTEKGPRLAIIGSIIDDSILETIVLEGGRIVFDGSCQGDMAFRETEFTSCDPFDQLYQRYALENICPHRRPIEPLLEYLTLRISEMKVDGVILASLMHCHPWGLSAKIIQERLGKPFLHLEEESGEMVSARTSTRIAAFIEMLALKGRRIP